MTDRIESKRMEKFGKIFLFLGIASLLILTLKILFINVSFERTGFWIDIAFMLVPVYLIYKGYKDSQTRMGQFIEWQDTSIQYKLKQDKSPEIIPIESISKIEIQLDKIKVETSGKEYVLDLTDFPEFEVIKKIKANFEQLKTNLKV